MTNPCGIGPDGNCPPMLISSVQKQMKGIELILRGEQEVVEEEVAERMVKTSSTATPPPAGISSADAAAVAAQPDPSSLTTAASKTPEEMTNRAALPELFRIRPCLRIADLRDAVLMGLEMNRSERRIRVSSTLRGRDVIKRHTGSVGSLCWVVRRPGCYFCREQAWTLSVFAGMYQEIFRGVEIFGIVKETGVDDDGLLDFQEKYFDYPLYCDPSMVFYQGLGNRRMTATLVKSPWSLISWLVLARRRIKALGIPGNLKGEGLIQGGMIILDASGSPFAMYQEQTSAELPLRDLALTLQALRRQSQPAAMIKDAGNVAEGTED